MRSVPARLPARYWFDGAATPTLWDFVHTNEEGARLVAAALYSRLLPQLQTKVEAATS